MTSTEDLARRFYQAFDTADPALLDEVLAPDWTPQPPVPGNPGGADGQKQTLHMLHKVFQGLRYQVEEVLVAGDTAAVRARLTGRQVGEFLGVPHRPSDRDAHHGVSPRPGRPHHHHLAPGGLLRRSPADDRAASSVAPAANVRKGSQMAVAW